jgi:hypothetical protein
MSVSPSQRWVHIAEANAILGKHECVYMYSFTVNSWLIFERKFKCMTLQMIVGIHKLLGAMLPSRDEHSVQALCGRLTVHLITCKIFS